MYRHLPANPKYGPLHTPDMPTRCEEHFRRTLGILSVPLAYSSLLFIGYLPDITRMAALLERDKPRQGVAANTLGLFRDGALGFIDRLDLI
jgi:hypothetical protein